MALPFLPVIAVRPAFDALCTDPVVGNSAAIRRFIAYFEPTWLDGQFPVHMWNVYHSNICTNNQVESWHSRLNRTVGLTHPNIYRLLETGTDTDRIDATTGPTGSGPSSTTTQVQRLGQATGQTARRVPAGTDDDRRVSGLCTTHRTPLLGLTTRQRTRQAVPDV